MMHNDFAHEAPVHAHKACSHVFLHPLHTHSTRPLLARTDRCLYRRRSEPAATNVGIQRKARSKAGPVSGAALKRTTTCSTGSGKTTKSTTSLEGRKRNAKVSSHPLRRCQHRLCHRPVVGVAVLLRISQRKKKTTKMKMAMLPSTTCGVTTTTTTTTMLPPLRAVAVLLPLPSPPLQVAAAAAVLQVASAVVLAIEGHGVHLKDVHARARLAM